jgi:hypothetical protein
MARGRSGATGADQYDAVEPRVRQPVDEPVAESRPVRVVPDRAAVVVEDDGVDRADRLRGWIERVEVRDDELLARVRDVQPAEPGDPCLPQQIADRLRWESQGVEIQPHIAVAQVELARLAHVQCRRQGRTDPGADQAHEEAVVGASEVGDSGVDVHRTPKGRTGWLVVPRIGAREKEFGQARRRLT